MSKRESKFYVCLHDACHFNTDKRKAIYTHLVRTHSERKEDYECEYCSQVFHRDSEIERHLHVHHPQKPFTYTCVSRIENVINTCAKLGSESRQLNADSDPNSNTIGHNKPVKKPDPNSLRTKASVNESLNNIARNSEHFFKPIDEEYITDEDDDVDDDVIVDDDDDDMEEVEIGTDDDDEYGGDTDDEVPMYVSEPSGLKIKLSLKKEKPGPPISNAEPSSSPPLLEKSSNESGFVDSTSPETQQSSNTKANSQIRDKASKYFDKLEVYHSTDRQGRRCCPFCDYKTCKNTIRVHLSGIHKIHFVKCSLCDYKAAFPHQITQHGLKFHKTRNLNVIQLSKEYREKIIQNLKNAQDNATSSDVISETDNINETAEDEVETGDSSESSADDSALEQDTSQNARPDERVFKVPFCQTSKTDYYHIQHENGVYLYVCNLCPFKTPVRATIYTHKYRHEEKSYMCGYCDYTSAPRSNVVHHLRHKHKGLPIKVREADEFPAGKSDNKDDITVKKGPLDPAIASPALTDHSRKEKRPQKIIPVDHKSTTSNIPDKPQQTIIKVPQFKRSSASVVPNNDEQPDDINIDKMAEITSGVEEYKLSLNKLYRINPCGSPKFLCVMCEYACDTHPKMKHHLYRHRPQKYKCPYCDHRKYPRSYVVRHVRDTHRNKPIRVIDLSKGNVPEDVPEYAQYNAGLDEKDEGISAENEDQLLIEPQNTQKTVKSEPTDNVYLGDDSNETNEEVNELKKFAQNLNLRSVLTGDIYDDTQTTNDGSGLDATSFTSTPLIESMINGQYQPTLPKVGQGSNGTGNTKNFEKKKSLKDYRVNYGAGPRYICNICGYGTENYKTIHNHMYRHESQRYQCPYCGYRRSPKSFVENHIREVHKGHPVIVTELTPDADGDTTVGSPRQSLDLKRKDSPVEVADDIPPTKQHKAATEFPTKWPAPKPISQISPAITSEDIPVRREQMDTSDNNQLNELNVRRTPLSLNISTPQTDIPKRHSTSKLSPPIMVNPVRFKEGLRTTYKTMYKCTFDPETCNHISKDKSKMKQHLFMHVEYKPWSCDFCEMTASQSSHIKNHVRSEHPGTPDTSFKYKKHNYLEKHIEGFLTKGLFTVPVHEYRAIMDMKGNTKASKQPVFTRDSEGNLECPYCPYKTRTGGMTDHVKMKHLQPRFKCHWCDYRAFYRSEVRKHHRKERNHGGLEFKTQELDLVQVVEGIKEKNGGDSPMVYPPITYILPLDPDDDDDDDDDADDEEDIDDRTSDTSSLGDLQQTFTEYTADQLSEFCSKQSGTLSQYLSDAKSLELKSPIQNPTNEYSSIPSPPSSGHESNTSNFKCGYCPFSAALRVKVKMHCIKKHSDMPQYACIIDPPSKVRSQSSLMEHTLRSKDNIVNVNSDEIKGTKFGQDLRKAGVSKLNLASLFPNSKRFKQAQNKLNKNKQSPRETNTEHNRSLNNGEFKKPLEPPLTSKAANNHAGELNVMGKVKEVRSGGKQFVQTNDADIETDTILSDYQNVQISSEATIDTSIMNVEKTKVEITYPNNSEVILEGDSEGSCDEMELHNDGDIVMENESAKGQSVDEVEREWDVKNQTVTSPPEDKSQDQQCETKARSDLEEMGVGEGKAQLIGTKSISINENIKLDGTEADNNDFASRKTKSSDANDNKRDQEDHSNDNRDNQHSEPGHGSPDHEGSTESNDSQSPACLNNENEECNLMGKAKHGLLGDKNIAVMDGDDMPERCVLEEMREDN